MRRPRRRTGMTLALALLGLMLLPGGPANATFPGPNGRIVFSDYMTGQIYAVNPDGTGQVQLTHTRSDVFAGDPTYSPDGRHIVYETNRGKGDAFRLWIMRADGSHKHMVTDNRWGFNFSPVYTPDGTRIVYTRCTRFTAQDTGERHFTCRIYSIGTDGSDRRGITTSKPPLEVFDFEPAVSPDGASIVFARRNHNIDGIFGQIYVMGIDGSDPQPLTPPRIEGWYPDWSPDGTHIAFTSNCCRPGSSGYVMKADGTNIQRLTNQDFPHNDVNFIYSPAGDKMVFASDRSYGDLCCTDMFVMNADGTQQTLIDTGLQGPHDFSWGTAPTIAATAPAPTTPTVGPAAARSRLAARCSALPRPFRFAEGCVTIGMRE